MRYCLVSILALALLATPAAAQVGAAARAAGGGSISGVVHDSVVGAPLARAIVQLVNADATAAAVGRTATTDSLGRYAFHDVPEGRYLLGFLHPMLDSLGLDPPMREVLVTGPAPVVADLAIPSAARLAAAACPAAGGAKPRGAIIGVVRDARTGAPAAGAEVATEWLELSVNRAGMARRTSRRTVSTAANGWFALCEVPSPGSVAVMGSRGADSTDWIEVAVPGEGIVRRDLYVGFARAIAATEGALRTDSAAPMPLLRSGDGRLSGVIVNSAAGTPVVGARIRIPNGPETLSNEHGEWMLPGVPLGTRMLEVRAIGYFPARSAVDVIEDAVPVHIELHSLAAMMDTVRVNAMRSASQASGFDLRRRGAMGRFIAPEDILRRRPIVTSDLFRMVPGVRVDRSPLGESTVTMRGIFTDECSPAVYIDGVYLSILGASDIDERVAPDEIAGIEIYGATAVPPAFHQGMSGCGSIVIWTAAWRSERNQRSLGERLLRGAGVVGLGVLVGALVMRF